MQWAEVFVFLCLFWSNTKVTREGFYCTGHSKKRKKTQLKQMRCDVMKKPTQSGEWRLRSVFVWEPLRRRRRVFSGPMFGD